MIRFLALGLTLLAFSSPTASAASIDCGKWLSGITAYLKDQATTSWKILLQDARFHRGRYRESFPAVRDAFTETWLSQLNQRPEAEFSDPMDTDEAVALLETLRDQTITLPKDSKQVYARPFNVTRGKRSASALVKQSHNRLQIDAPTATEQVTVGNGSRMQVHVARWEVMAFKLDRFFGMNLVPPSTMIAADQSAQLLIPSRAADYRKQIRDPASLLDLSMIRMLDAILSNADRAFPGNFRVTARGRALAVDFDLSSPVMVVEAAIRRRLIIKDYPVRSGLLGRGWHPGVYSRRMIERMDSLVPEDLDRMAREGGMPLTDDEKRAIYSGVRTVARVVRELAAEYGEDLVWVP